METTSEDQSTGYLYTLRESQKDIETRKKNLGTAWIDNRKSLDSIVYCTVDPQLMTNPHNVPKVAICIIGCLLLLLWW